MSWSDFDDFNEFQEPPPVNYIDYDSLYATIKNNLHGRRVPVTTHATIDFAAICANEIYNLFQCSTVATITSTIRKCVGGKSNCTIEDCKKCADVIYTLLQ